jgi:hypothetical protein
LNTIVSGDSNLQVKMPALSNYIEAEGVNQSTLIINNIENLNEPLPRITGTDQEIDTLKSVKKIYPHRYRMIKIIRYTLGDCYSITDLIRMTSKSNIAIKYF